MREVEAEGENTGSVVREDAGWIVFRGAAEAAAAHVRMDADTAWKLLFNALPPDAARSRVSIAGDPTLAEPLLRARAVMV